MPQIPQVSSLSEKPSGATDALSNNALVNTIRDTYASFQARRESLGLSNPGTVENVAKEVQRDVFLNNLSFSGLRADLTKAFSVAPLFQVSHAFSQGSQQIPPYAFLALFGTNKIFCQGNLDSDLSLSARFNYRWTPRWITKTTTQIQAGSMAGPGAAQFSFENDYAGNDFTAQIKAMNPSILDGPLTGIFIGSYMQSITPRLSLGLEAVYQRAAAQMGPETMLSYAGRYKGDDWIASAQLMTAGGLQTSYWKRLSDKLETGVDLNLQVAGMGGAQGGMMGGIRKEGVATFGAKYDFRASSFRAQVDSAGKLGVLLEKRVVPMVQITFAGELDHAKNAAKLGLAVSIEAAEEEVMQAAETVASSPVVPPF
ncbi:eukaryotic porin-domain-containing protein [Delphinella strobiligena]|nr:eukaryotic porin-domain-containing protein [Delphinella strobiligena]